MRAMELNVTIVTGEFEAAAAFLTKIADIVKDHGEVIRMTTSTHETEVKVPQYKLEVSAEAESYPLDELRDPIDMGIPTTDHGPGLAPEEEG